MVKQLLIIGDSFSASTDSSGWNNLITDYQIKNLSFCGTSEYRLIKTLDQFDPIEFHKIVFVHTSPNRIYVNENPYYTDSSTHKNCDLLYTDIESYLPDEYAEHVTWWFKNVFDLEQADFVHQMSLDHIMKKLPATLHLTFFDYQHPGLHNLHKVWKKNPGKINHMNEQGNQQVFNFIKEYL